MKNLVLDGSEISISEMNTLCSNFINEKINGDFCAEKIYNSVEEIEILRWIRPAFKADYQTSDYLKIRLSRSQKIVPMKGAVYTEESSTSIQSYSLSSASAGSHTASKYTKISDGSPQTITDFLENGDAIYCHNGWSHGAFDSSSSMMQVYQKGSFTVLPLTLRVSIGCLDGCGGRDFEIIIE